MAALPKKQLFVVWFCSNVLPQSVTHTAIGHGIKFQIERTEGILASATHFQTLLLPLPRINILGDAEWDVTEAVIKKSYRDLCVKIHPDKCRFERSAEVFNAVRFEATYGALSRSLSAMHIRSNERHAFTFIAFDLSVGLSEFDMTGQGSLRCASRGALATVVRL